MYFRLSAITWELQKTCEYTQITWIFHPDFILDEVDKVTFRILLGRNTPVKVNRHRCAIAHSRKSMDKIITRVKRSQYWKKARIRSDWTKSLWCVHIGNWIPIISWIPRTESDGCAINPIRCIHIKVISVRMSKTLAPHQTTHFFIILTNLIVMQTASNFTKFPPSLTKAYIQLHPHSLEFGLLNPFVPVFNKVPVPLKNIIRYRIHQHNSYGSLMFHTHVRGNEFPLLIREFQLCQCIDLKGSESR